MTNRSRKSVKVVGKVVNVSGSPGQGKSKSRRSRSRVRMQAAPAGVNQMPKAQRQPRITNRAADLAALQEINTGRMAIDKGDLISLSDLARLKSTKCSLDSNEQGWFFKYIDPAGATESGRAIGEFSKIPDGLCTFSVDAEIRVVRNLAVPAEDISSTLPLDGRIWSLVVISYPLFRIGAILVANTFNASIGQDVRVDLASSLNSLVDVRTIANDQVWVPFSTPGLGWYFMIIPLPPTFDAPDPIAGDTRTVTDFRLTYKGITITTNAPFLVNQGMDVGGHYALSPGIIAQETQELMMVPTFILFRNIPPAAGGIFNFVNITIQNLPRPSVGTVDAPGVVVFSPASGFATDVSFFSINLQRTTSPTMATYTLLDGESWFLSPGQDPAYAVPGDIVTFTTVITLGVVTAVAFLVNGDVTTTQTVPIDSLVWASAMLKIFMDLPQELEVGGTTKSIEFPALAIDQIFANNPKAEVTQIDHSKGAYLVHRKIRNPVFALTPAQNYGPIQFTAPGTSVRDFSPGTGLMDTIDSNFSTGVAVFMGIAHSNSPIFTLYQGWEGITNTNTTFGQFGHAGLPKNEELLNLVDAMSTETTGFYPAKSNFAASLCTLGASLLRGIFRSEATQGLMRDAARAVVNRGVMAANRMIG